MLESFASVKNNRGWIGVQTDRLWKHQTRGKPAGLGSRDLRDAEEWAQDTCRRGSRVAAAWKLLGDVYATYRLVDPLSEQDAEGKIAADVLAR